MNFVLVTVTVIAKDHINIIEFSCYIYNGFQVQGKPIFINNVDNQYIILREAVIYVLAEFVR